MHDARVSSHSAESQSLPGGFSEAELRQAITSARSWRGVLRALERTSPKLGRQLREAALVRAIDFSHFTGSVDVVRLRRVVTESASWREVLVALGYDADSGSGRAAVRRQCQRAGVDTAHLASPAPPPRERAFAADVDLRYLRSAAPAIVAGELALRGYAISWPSEPAAYDLIADGAGGLQRIQVKSNTLKQDGAWSCKLTRSQPGPAGRRRAAYSTEEIDFFACVDGERAVYLIPAWLLEGFSVIYLRKYESFRLSAEGPRPGTGAESGGDGANGRADRI